MSQPSSSRGGASPGARSPSIAPLASESQGGPAQSASVGGGAHPAASQGTGNTTSQRSPSHLIRGVRSPTAAMSGAQSGRTAGLTPGGTTNTRVARPDLGRTPAVRPMVQLSDTDIPDVDAEGGTAGTANTVIWGTNINAESLSRKVEAFLWGCRDVDTGEEKYTELIKRCLEDGGSVLNLDTGDVRATDRTLYKWLVAYPHEVLPMFDMHAKRIMAQQASTVPDDPALPDIIVRPFNLEGHKTIRDLDPADIDKLICVEGMVTRTSNVIPDLRVAFFRCAKCSHEYQVFNEGGKVEEPSKCTRCSTKSAFELVHNRCDFSNKQVVKMQEKPNDIPEGETPHAVLLHVYEANVDVCRPGDRVSITGILRALPMRVNPTQRALHAVFKTYIDVMHVSRDEKSRLFSLAATREADAAKAAAAATAEATAPAAEGSQHHSASGLTGLTSNVTGGEGADGDGAAAGVGQDVMHDQGENLGNDTHDQIRAAEERIRALSRDPRIYERLVASMAPNVWEMDNVKKGLLVQLFGGSMKNFPGGRIRGEINLLLVGDPSVSKSQLLNYVHALAPRGIMTSGKGSSAVGLTAYVTRDPETKEMVLESGALVLSDHGVCCIDEFDKMSEGARSMLHEAMEQQTVSIAKAGLISTLNARTSICACANPIGSRYNPHLTVAENINLPPTLLTRFDLIYLILDKCDEEKDRKLARHLVSLFHEVVPKRATQEELFIEKDVLKEYIAFARTRINPQLNEEAIEELVKAYGTLRQDGRDRKVVVATPRQLESLIRISEALSRMRLSEVVGRAEVEEAVRLWYTAMQGSAAGDNGDIDMDNIFTGTTTAARQAKGGLPDTLRAIIQDPSARPMTVDDLYSAVQRANAASGSGGSVTRQQLLDAVRTLDTILTYDERTGVIRPRATAAGAGAPQTA